MQIESRFGFLYDELHNKSTISISGSSIEQRGYKKVEWIGCRLHTLVEWSRLVLVMSVLSLKMNGTSVAFTWSGDCDPSRQPKPLQQS